ncbi:MAG TPA: VWA domain-containing protein [Propionibacteriaceae bacterium]|nr:VWA domain-containing protein [Propionibacteriaceae bacterium]
MTNPHLTHIEFLLDRSGSMQSIREDIEGGFNAFIADQRQGTGTCTVSLAQFDDAYEVVYTDIGVHDVPPLQLHPRGSTALLDAIGRTIDSLGERLASMDEDERPGSVIVPIMTDGHENASRRFTHPQIKAMIERQEGVYDWTFLYMGADQDAIEVGGSMGIAPGRSMTYDRGSAPAAYAVMSANLLGVRRAAAAGASGRDKKRAAEFSDAQRDEAAPGSR